MFNSARLKLTSWYLIIIMLISLSFSLVIYRVLTHELDRLSRLQRARFERLEVRNFPPPPELSSPELIAETKRRLMITLILINGGILILAGSLGYFLAGQTLKPIKKMVEAQNRFISDASHELRTPLTALKSAIEVNLREPKLSLAKAKKLLRDNLADIDELSRLTNALLEINYQTPLSVKPSPTTLTALINSSIKSMLSLAQSKQIKITWINPTDEQISLDSLAIKKVVQILLDNAIKYSSEKTAITLETKFSGTNLIIKVKDQGMGIEPKDLPYIFDRFFRADQARTKNQTSGYGLGLAIAKELILAHHGQIKVKSQLGVGSEFILSLPVIN